jgi:hypothetical protein
MIMNKSIERAGKTVGIGLAIMFFFSILADSVIMPKIIIWHDVMQTSNNIIANEQMFRIGVLSYWGDMLANVLIAFALYILLKPVNNTIAILAAGFRLVYVIIRSTALLNLVKVLDVLKPEGIVLSEISTKVMHLLEADKAGYSYALIFFGFHVLLIGYLIVKSGYIPKILGLLLIIAFIGYQVYCMAFIFDTDFTNRENMYKLILGIPGVISELSLCLWLLIKKIK